MSRIQRGWLCRGVVAAVLLAACAHLAILSVGAAQQPVVSSPPPLAPAPASAPSDCTTCHSCEQPTTEMHCLRTCPRPISLMVPFEPKKMEAPNVVLLGELEDRYLPVPFDHKGHAAMAGITRGCIVCHHYTPEGAAHPACKTCHEVSPSPQEIRKPGLKGAYHRQCLNCHREWSSDTKCEICHQSKTGREGRLTTGGPPTKDDIMGRMHPPIPEPDTEIFQARAEPKAGTSIFFHHREHIHRFGLACVECHHEDNCSRCHDGRPREPVRVRTFEDHHQPCLRCHNTTNAAGCDKCHWEEGKLKPSRFDHASVGFVLQPYHERDTCRTCHRDVPFRKLDRDCASCHSAWSQAGFDHRVTGLRLDDIHAAFDCEQCHLENQFDRLPTCGECHEEKENIRFPEKRPGKVVPINRR